MKGNQTPEIKWALLNLSSICGNEKKCSLLNSQPYFAWDLLSCWTTEIFANSMGETNSVRPLYSFMMHPTIFWVMKTNRNKNKPCVPIYLVCNLEASNTLYLKFFPSVCKIMNGLLMLKFSEYNLADINM